MKPSSFPRARACLTGGALLAAVATTPAHAIVVVDVGATYEGTIFDDGGLGLTGKTMSVAFSYDPDIPPDYIFNGIGEAGFSYVVKSMSVSIDDHTWTWTGPYSYVNLVNDGITENPPQIEDHWTLGAFAFTGPDVTGEPARSYVLEMSFVDDTPDRMPDGLEDHELLPATAPNPALFNADVGNIMAFSFYTGAAGASTQFVIRANDIRLVSAVPEPETYAMWLMGLGLLGALARRPRR